ncbi:unnamed protein product [Sphenostylis stenocarpa]|uniref:Alpha N-terminal protein methyltransferase 1 n=1 Tax=Sphenostylis stenocarpa TaxID=92480 RepID=A0AA86SCJ0_9FABA|nr:unnamed protein product [Sphenostylis stenocarpa]
MLRHCVPSCFVFRTRTPGLTTSDSHFASLFFSQNRKIYRMDAAGLDSYGREFETADEMWREHAGDSSKKTQWYRDGVSYWEGVNATMDGVLGGFANVNEPDISCSEDFLKILLSERFPPDASRQPLVVLDCGSGIGRLTKNLLIRYFNEVDLLEPVSHFLEAARETLAAGCQTNTVHKAVNFYCVPLQLATSDSTVDCDLFLYCLCLPAAAFDLFHRCLQCFLSPSTNCNTAMEPLQCHLLSPFSQFTPLSHSARFSFFSPSLDFTPDTGRYDVIWIQWCIGHLTDEDFVSFFKRAKVGLKPGGFFVLKENIARSGFVLDNEDRSVTRSDMYFKELFSQCGLHVYRSKDQTGFPEGLFAVKMYALTTDAPKRAPRAKSKTSTNRPRTIM